MRSMVEGFFQTPQNPSTTLRVVPLPGKGRGGLIRCRTPIFGPGRLCRSPGCGTFASGEGGIMHKAIATAAAFAILSASSAPASAQGEGPPDPATVELPDLTPSRDPEVIANGGKHFYFHMAGVSYAEAYEDFSECYRYLPVAGGVDVLLPMFAPWGRTPGVEAIQPANNYGLVGMGIAALFLGPIERKSRQSRLRRCLETRGYVRYPLSEKVWNELIDGYSERSIAVQAKAASMPAPDARPVTR
jgi:hypothetical protein